MRLSLVLCLAALLAGCSGGPTLVAGSEPGAVLVRCDH